MFCLVTEKRSKQRENDEKVSSLYLIVEKIKEKELIIEFFLQFHVLHLFG